MKWNNFFIVTALLAVFSGIYFHNTNIDCIMNDTVLVLGVDSLFYVTGLLCALNGLAWIAAGKRGIYTNFRLEVIHYLLTAVPLILLMVAAYSHQMSEQRFLWFILLLSFSVMVMCYVMLRAVIGRL
ncbi:MAG: hypothetical protein IPL08_09110 [Saprospiraceae bacterium]|nr:hypothetical protein [Saprospiraceae bacterium]MBK8671213.1 hypothetical protein [Saprospiraceae bacterium]MBL0101686.1 hypothetical protein [Saprospiraceae bacterium]